MAKYQTKHFIVDAVQHQRGRIIAGVLREFPNPFQYSFQDAPYYIDIDGMRNYLNEGDWIITESNGKKHVCPDATFQRAYEPCTEGDSAAKDMGEIAEKAVQKATELKKQLEETQRRAEAAELRADSAEASVLSFQRNGLKFIMDLKSDNLRSNWASCASRINDQGYAETLSAANARIKFLEDTLQARNDKIEQLSQETEKLQEGLRAQCKLNIALITARQPASEIICYYDPRINAYRYSFHSDAAQQHQRDLKAALDYSQKCHEQRDKTEAQMRQKYAELDAKLIETKRKYRALKKEHQALIEDKGKQFRLNYARLWDTAKSLFDNRTQFSSDRQNICAARDRCAPRIFWANLGEIFYGEKDTRVQELRDGLPHTYVQTITPETVWKLGHSLALTAPQPLFPFNLDTPVSSENLHAKPTEGYTVTFKEVNPWRDKYARLGEMLAGHHWEEVDLETLLRTKLQERAAFFMAKNGGVREAAHWRAKFEEISGYVSGLAETMLGAQWKQQPSEDIANVLKEKFDLISQYPALERDRNIWKDNFERLATVIAGPQWQRRMLFDLARQAVQDSHDLDWLESKKRYLFWQIELGAEGFIIEDVRDDSYPNSIREAIKQAREVRKAGRHA